MDEKKSYHVTEHKVPGQNAFHQIKPKTPTRVKEGPIKVATVR